jgi:hypothetical protein
LNEPLNREADMNEHDIRSLLHRIDNADRMSSASLRRLASDLDARCAVVSGHPAFSWWEAARVRVRGMLTTAAVAA